MTTTENKFRDLPSVDKLLATDESKALVETYSHGALVTLARDSLQAARQCISDGGPAPSLEALVEEIARKAKTLWKSSPRRVINATGVVIHTNLGRAPLSEEAAKAAMEAGAGYSDLEIDLEKGERGGRDATLKSLVSRLTGAESAVAVNNNAAALHLILSVLALGRDVIVSRGEAVEIGGGVRVPEILSASGARLVEVGTTNRTYLSDYRNAITENTALFLKVHTSNFKVIGFTEVPDTGELAALGREAGIPVVHDVGSGCLVDTRDFGLSDEPRPQDSIAAGMDLVAFSGDKLLGGPQAGIIAGRQVLVSELARHPLARAARIDKMTMAALTATLLHYLKEEHLDKVPVWRMISMPLETIKLRALEWRDSIGNGVDVVETTSAIGGGSLPGDTLPTWALQVRPPNGVTVDSLAKSLRTGPTPVLGRIDDDALLLDPRTVLPEQEAALKEAVIRGLGRGPRVAVQLEPVRQTETYRCLTCSASRVEGVGWGERHSECGVCGGSAFLVGTLDPPPLEVHLRHMRVEEALIKLDKYLDTAFLSGLHQVRIVHGKGQGKVRSAVIEWVAGHQLVSSFRGAALEEGGWGVTVVTMAR